MSDLIGREWEDLLPHIEDSIRSGEFEEMNTWTLTAIAKSSWGIPRTLEIVRGVKTNKKTEVADSLYIKYPECREVTIQKESK